ncbi:MAG: DUF4143 domain-containing protein [Lachnospiraceae bacterium]|nr:DUF4143 domain-containing protein [Lachnospiraceae bacterium]
MQVSRDPLRGNLFENMVVIEAMKARINQNRDPNLYYMRTAKGVEVDLIMKSGGTLYLKNTTEMISGHGKLNVGEA